MEDTGQEICRVCRTEAAADRPLYHPCICTGSIKFIHQECLVQWLRYSKKDYCELCNHHFSFMPIYSADMPKRLPTRDIVHGLLASIGAALKCWLHYTLVWIAWLLIVPLIAARIYKCLFAMSFSSLLSLPLDILSTENVMQDSMCGFVIVISTLCFFIAIVWLREQIVHGGAPEWLEPPLPPRRAADNRGGAAGEPQVFYLYTDEEEAGEDDDDDDINDDRRIIEENGNDIAAAQLAAEQRGGNPIEAGGGEPHAGPPRRRRERRAAAADGAVEHATDGGPAENLAAADAVVERVAPGDGQVPAGAAVVADDVLENNRGAGIGAAGIREGAADGAVGGHAGENWRALDLQAVARQAGLVNNPDDDDQGQWNAEWERGGEDITWQRLLGLDGSLVFLEHMFWVLSLNTLFMFLFALVPFYFGEWLAALVDITQHVEQFEFRGPLVTFIGYIVAAFILMMLYMLCQGARFRRARRIVGLCYLIIKVSLLAVAEVGLLPMVCGAWLNICSMELFGNSLPLLQTHLKAAPATNAFLHWLIGMIYIYYFAFFVLLLREVVRPGVLWFLQNINDPDFHPIQEMIQMSVMLHVRRLVVSLVIFGSAILLMVWLPLRIMKRLTPSLIPYNVSMQTADMPSTEISMELMILQVVLPALLEQGHTKQFVKWCVKLWCRGVSSVLGIGSYLLGEQNDGEGRDGAAADGDAQDNEREENVQQQPRELAAVHQALVNAHMPSPNVPYVRSTYFAFRIAGLLLCVCVTLTLVSMTILTVPVSVGRWVMSIAIPNTRLHEFYTVGAGLYVCWLAIRAVSLARSWLPRGWSSIYQSLLSSALVGLKALTVCVLLLGLVPLLIGIHFDLIIVIPLRVPLHASPVLYLFHDWALGVLHTKIIGALTLVGPNWWLKAALDQVYQDGVRNMNVTRIVRDIVLPCVAILGLSLSLPYIFVHSVLAHFVSDATLHLSLRRIYPTLLLGILLSWYAVFQWRQFRRLYEHIKNDKYLVGRRLVNYERQQQQQQQQQQLQVA